MPFFLLTGMDEIKKLFNAIDFWDETNNQSSGLYFLSYPQATLFRYTKLKDAMRRAPHPLPI